MLRPLLAVQVGLALSCMPVPPLSAQEHDPQLQERFMEGVKQSWEKLQHISFRARCVATMTGGGSDRVDTYEIGIRGRNGLQTGVRDEITFVHARNDVYAFMLHRSKAGNSLQFVERVGVDPSIDAEIAAAEREPRAMALAAYYLWTEPLARVVEGESFEMKRVYAVPSEGQEFVRVEFNYVMEDPQLKTHDSYTDGYIICDPARGWVVKEYGASVDYFSDGDPRTQKIVLEHADAIGEMPVATKITNTSAAPDISYASKSVISHEVIARDLPEEELYLSHYDLPEPTFRDGRLGAWVWYLIAGLVCLIVSARLLKRRRAAG